jgi:hypothetical protein
VTVAYDRPGEIPATTVRSCALSMTIPDPVRRAGYQAWCPRCFAFFRDSDEWAGSVCHPENVDPEARARARALLGAIIDG